MSTEEPAPRRRTTKKAAAPKKAPAAAKKAAPAAPAPAPVLPPPPPPPPPPAEPVAQPVVAQPAATEHGEGSGRLRTAMAVLIAMISVTGALVTWRAEVAGSEAGRADREGTIVSVTAEGARQQAEAQARAEGRAAQRAYEAWAASQIYKKVRESAASNGAFNAADRKFLQEDGVALKLTDGYFVLDFVKHDEFGYPTDPAYDVGRRVEDLLAQGQTETDSGRFFDEADHMESTRSKLFAIDVGLVVALALIAIGQVTRRRRTALMWAGPGLVLFIVATSLFAAVEA